MTAQEFIEKYGQLPPLKLEDSVYSFHGWVFSIEVLACDVSMEMTLNQIDEQIILRRKDLANG